jgi:hypothetical protein
MSNFRLFKNGFLQDTGALLALVLGQVLMAKYWYFTTYWE